MNETLFEYAARQPIFHGSDIDNKRDTPRLTKQILRVYNAMKDGQWRSLGDIEEITGDGQASISAQLRNLKKRDFGCHNIEKRHVKGGLFEYRLVL